MVAWSPAKNEPKIMASRQNGPKVMNPCIASASHVGLCGHRSAERATVLCVNLRRLKKNSLTKSIFLFLQGHPFKVLTPPDGAWHWWSNDSEPRRWARAENRFYCESTSTMSSQTYAYISSVSRTVCERFKTISVHRECTENCLWEALTDNHSRSQT